jgi:uncharacterized protein YuzB (UPF0349 family)
MKFLLVHTFCFIAIVLGSTAALPAHEEDPNLDIVHSAKVKKTDVSDGKINMSCSSFYKHKVNFVRNFYRYRCMSD